jgi:hypothetical protein
MRLCRFDQERELLGLGDWLSEDAFIGFVDHGICWQTACHQATHNFMDVPIIYNF